MKAVKLKDNLYKKAERLSKTHGIKLEVLISKALNQGLDAAHEKTILELYRNRKISLQKAAEMLSITLWDMIEKLRISDLHLDYINDDLMEDVK